jgi:hypothetical protein
MKKELIWAILGLWLIISPFILGGPMTVLAYSNALVGTGMIIFLAWMIFGRK